MKKTVPFLLALALVVGLIVPGTLATQASAADGDNTSTSSGLVIDKTAKAVEGGFEITLEAYATGNKVITSVKKDVPTDVILVLDQSGSMSNAIGTVSFTAISGNNRRNATLYDRRHNGGSANLWYKLSDGSYVSVSVSKTQTFRQLFSMSNSEYFYYANNLYEKVGDEYKKVTLEVSGNGGNRIYTYTFSDGITITSRGGNTTPNLSGHGPLYTPNEAVYTYTYTDSTGTVQTIGTSTGNGASFTGETLYTRSVNSNDGESRLSALKTAVATFVESVETKAKGADGIRGNADDINHRIAIVGFASQSGYGNNTELLSIAGSNSDVSGGNEQVGIAYDDIETQNYKDVLQSMNTDAGVNIVTDAINALAAQGATQTDLGMTMAENILKNNPLQANEKRNRVVILFSDGAPTTYDGFEKDVANDAITAANTIKTAYKATVYSVGIFAGADATSAGTEPSGNLENNSSSMNAACNWFMQKVSSNNGIVNNPGYYLSAADSASLNRIFQQIADQIESSNSSTELNASSVVKDIIAPQFQLPAGATASNITLETYNCTGKDSSGKCTFSTNKNATAMGAIAKINADGTVDVTGFDFAANWCGTETNNGTVTPRGSKLIIKFTVQTKDGFLGGNDVYTNTEAKIYASAEDAAKGENAVDVFPRPQVNVPIQDVTVTAGNRNVYLLGDLTAGQIKAGATARCGDVYINLAEENYGLEPWQYEYVTITTTYTAPGGNTVADLSDLRDDTTYTVSVTVAPKTPEPTSTEGTKAEAKTNSATGNIHVFTPTLTFRDSTVYYGDTAPTDFSGNKSAELWKHDGTLDTAVTMTGDKPTLTLDYNPGTGIDTAGKIATKNDIPVDVTVNIGTTDVTGSTAFIHQACTDRTDNLPQGKKFLLHVKTSSLTIKKQAATGTTIGSDEYFVFNIRKDGAAYTQVTIQGTGFVTISQLPVGTYTVEEDDDTAWRYDSSMSNGAVELSKDRTSATVTCTNGNKDNKWLNHFARVINTFGDKN